MTYKYVYTQVIFYHVVRLCENSERPRGNVMITTTTIVINDLRLYSDKDNGMNHNMKVTTLFHHGYIKTLWSALKKDDCPFSCTVFHAC